VAAGFRRNTALISGLITLPTTEIDYSGHHPVLLYAAVAQINYWSEVGGDVYDIPKADFFPSA
jgi:hypothetical protein